MDNCDDKLCLNNESFLVEIINLYALALGSRRKYLVTHPVVTQLR